MTLLERAGQFYTALLLEKKQSDPKVIQFRSYVTNLFQQEGYQMVLEIERQHKTGALKDPAAKPGKQQKTSAPAYAKGYEPESKQPQRQVAKRELRPFQHPAKGLGKTAAPLHRFKRTPRLPVDQEGPDNSGQPLPNSGATQAAMTTKGAGDAAAAADKKSGRKTAATFTPAEIEEIAGMQPTAIARKFDGDRIRAYLKAKNVRFNATASDRQVAANLLGYLTKKGE